jgi:hypothetical protein
MLNNIDKKVSLANASAVCLTATASPLIVPNSGNIYMLITYKTKDEHNFYPGAQVNINGFTLTASPADTSSLANFCNVIVYSIPDSKTFTISSGNQWTNKTIYTFTGPGTARLISTALNSVELIYAYPNLSTNS